MELLNDPKVIFQYFKVFVENSCVFLVEGKLLNLVYSRLQVGRIDTYYTVTCHVRLLSRSHYVVLIFGMV